MNDNGAKREEYRYNVRCHAAHKWGEAEGGPRSAPAVTAGACRKGRSQSDNDSEARRRPGKGAPPSHNPQARRGARGGSGRAGRITTTNSSQHPQGTEKTIRGLLHIREFTMYNKPTD